MLKKFNQFGSSMIEMLGVLTIITMLGISVIKLVGNIFDMFKQNLVISEIKEVQKLISDRYKFEGNYRTLFQGRTPEQVVAYLCNQKMVPYQMCVNGEMHHRMGGSVWVLPVEMVEGEGIDYEKYALVFEDLSDKTCVEAAQINWYMQHKSEIFQMIVNSNMADKRLAVEMPHKAQADSRVFPVNVSDVMDACSTDGENTIEWVFY